MKNSHIPVMLEEVLSYIPSDKKINVIDATFGGGSYSKSILSKFNVNKLIAIDRDPISKFFAKDLVKNFNNFSLINGCFSRIDSLILQTENKNTRYDAIIFDLGLSSNQLDNGERGFSFMNDGPLDMGMGNNDKKAADIVNNYSEEKLADIIFKYG